jgi:hypothetical protein
MTFDLCDNVYRDFVQSVFSLRCGARTNSMGVNLDGCGGALKTDWTEPPHDAVAYAALSGDYATFGSISLRAISRSMPPSSSIW